MQPIPSGLLLFRIGTKGSYVEAYALLDDIPDGKMERSWVKGYLALLRTFAADRSSIESFSLDWKWELVGVKRIFCLFIAISVTASLYRDVRILVQRLYDADSCGSVQVQHMR